MYMKEPTREVPVTTSRSLKVALAITAGTIVLLGVYPAPLLDLATAAMAEWEQATLAVNGVLP
jgi:NADH:ubiquinone oxidoreductase subunit 2 (subunit N)